jgi:hypothetical protein
MMKQLSSWATDLGFSSPAPRSERKDASSGVDGAYKFATPKRTSQANDIQVLFDDVDTVLNSVCALTKKQIAGMTELQKKLLLASGKKLELHYTPSDEDIRVRSKEIAFLMLAEFLSSAGPALKATPSFINFFKSDMLESVKDGLTVPQPSIVVAAGKAMSLLNVNFRDQMKSELATLVPFLLRLATGGFAGASLYEHRLCPLKTIAKICASHTSNHDIFAIKSSPAAEDQATKTAPFRNAATIAQEALEAAMRDYPETLSDSLQNSLKQHLGSKRASSDVKSGAAAQSGTTASANGVPLLFQNLISTLQSFANGTFSGSDELNVAEVASLRLVANRALVSVMHSLLSYREKQPPSSGSCDISTTFLSVFQ